MTETVDPQKFGVEGDQGRDDDEQRGAGPSTRARRGGQKLLSPDNSAPSDFEDRLQRIPMKGLRQLDAKVGNDADHRGG